MFLQVRGVRQAWLDSLFRVSEGWNQGAGWAGFFLEALVKHIQVGGIIQLPVSVPCTLASCWPLAGAMLTSEHPSFSVACNGAPNISCIGRESLWFPTSQRKLCFQRAHVIRLGPPGKSPFLWTQSTLISSLNYICKNQFCQITNVSMDVLSHQIHRSHPYLKGRWEIMKGWGSLRVLRILSVYFTEPVSFLFKSWLSCFSFLPVRYSVYFP